MGENSDFIHRDVPRVAFQRDGFKYHLKHKIRKAFLKNNGYTSHFASPHILLLFQYLSHFVINIEVIWRQFSTHMSIKDKIRLTRKTKY